MEIEFIEKINLVNDIWKLVFTKPSAFIYEAGDYVDLAVKNVDAKMLSMSSNPKEKNLEFTIRIPVNPSNYKRAISELKPGDKCYISPAIGNFNLPKTKKEIVFVALGIGITPYRSMLLENNLPEITLIYSAKPTEYIYEQDIRKSGAKYIKHKSRLTATDVLENAKISNTLIYLAGPEGACIELYTKLLQADIPRHQIKLEYFTGYKD